MEEQVQMNEKLRALLEKAKREKKIASKDLIDTLEARTPSACCACSTARRVRST